ncbi:sugar transferase [Streptomyces qinzhouensis]|uniref:Sugar transferase n=1 Tax=Streptomyces qinzhouensis TaxID=2599401 RepID=A0A5B8JDI0_9ACTN|nr:sugar transferase [Streptomyces qinzhouensis]QDY78021.1 sugar transferase [Streptomyces qinzhouensis]
MSPSKRAVDLLGAALLLLLLAPALPVLLTAVAVSARGPVLVPKPCTGAGGRPFRMLTFRVAPGTRTGRLLHRHYLDHLPQLVNVLRGEMSLVGPRPLPVDRILTGSARARTSVRPGITGLWQTGGRSGLPWEEMAVQDLHYVREHWLGMDLKILVRTLSTARRGRPARAATAGAPARVPRPQGLRQA